MSMIEQDLGLRLFHEHDSVSIWSETLSGALCCVYLVGGSFMSMVVQVLGLMLFREHNNANISSKHDIASIWSETLS